MRFIVPVLITVAVVGLRLWTYIPAFLNFILNRPPHEYFIYGLASLVLLWKRVPQRMPTRGGVVALYVVFGSALIFFSVQFCASLFPPPFNPPYVSHSPGSSKALPAKTEPVSETAPGFGLPEKLTVYQDGNRYRFTASAQQLHSLDLVLTVGRYRFSIEGCPVIDSTIPCVPANKKSWLVNGVAQSFEFFNPQGHFGIPQLYVSRLGVLPDPRILEVIDGTVITFPSIARITGVVANDRKRHMQDNSGGWNFVIEKVD